MTDRALGARFVVVTHLGRTDLGETTVAIDEEALHIIVSSARAEHPIRVPLGAIDAVVLSGVELVVPLRDGRSMTFVAQTTVELRDEILGRCRALPELTHALRAFGSRRWHRSTRASAAADQQRFFAPLLDARREAVSATSASAAMAAFDADALASALESQLRGFAAERYGTNAPARRALEAELLDLSEPLKESLLALRDAARDATEAADDLRLWRRWARQLGSTFETADRVWLSLDLALDSNPWKL